MLARRKRNNQPTTNQVQNQPKLTIKQTENRWKELFNRNRVDNPFIYGMNIGSAFGNNPFIANQRVRNLSTQAYPYNRDSIEKALLDPGNNEMLLRGATHNVLNQTYPLLKLLYMYEGILAYHNYVQPLYVDKKDMTSPRFKSDEKFIDMWVKKLAPKKTFRRIVSQVLMEGKRAYLLRQCYENRTGSERVDYVELKDVPSDWFRITGISSESYYTISFDFMYFTTPGANLNQFPPIFTDIFNQLLGYRKIDDFGQVVFDPNQLSECDNVSVEYDSITGTWAYWAEIPANIAWVFSFSESDATVVSPFVSLLLQGSDLADYNALQQQLVSAPLASLILGEIGLSPDTHKTGFDQDMYDISPEAVAMWEGSINGTLANQNIAYKMTPSTKNVMFNVPSIPNAQTIANDAVSQLINTTGSSALQPLNEKSSVSQTNAAKVYEGRFIDRIYAQFEHFVNTIWEDMYYAGDLKYRWVFRIFGNTFLEKEEYQDIEKSLSMGQLHLLPHYLAMRGMSLLDANTMSDYVEATGIYEKMKPLVSSFTTSSETVEGVRNNIESKKATSTSDTGGRPPIENSDNENTDASKNLGDSDARNE